MLPEYEKYKELAAEIQLRTILQHAWAEMEHDIQYKSAESIPIPVSTRRRFMSLAGMLEIADREFQAIQDEDQKLRSEVKESVEQDLREARKSITQEPQEVKEINLRESNQAEDQVSQETDELSALQSYVAELEKRIRGSSEPITTSTYQPGSARALADRGYYEEAVRAYDAVIKLHRGVHTNYIGRARARALAGDMEGALDDLEYAEELYPYDPIIERVRQQILQHAPPTTPSVAGAYQETALGNQELSRGAAQEAIEHYEKAKRLGYNYIFSTFNQAMARCLSGNIDEAINLLNSFRPLAGSHMVVNSLALRAIGSIRKGHRDEELLLQLQRLCSSMKFDFSRSPLRYLESGLRAIDEYEVSDEVFSILKGA